MSKVNVHVHQGMSWKAENPFWNQKLDLILVAEENAKTAEGEVMNSDFFFIIKMDKFEEWLPRSLLWYHNAKLSPNGAFPVRVLFFLDTAPTVHSLLKN